MMRGIIITCLVSLLLGCQTEDVAFTLPDIVDFNLHIRPVLSNNCYVCHGPDISSRKADLRLDLEAFVKGRTNSGHRPVVEGNARRSELYRRISSDDPENIMPPPETNRSLTDYEIALIGKWIDQGAGWKKHWAFIPPSEQERQDPEGHPVDYFIDQRLQTKGLVRAETAANSGLARRLSFILTGLPPQREDLTLDLSDPGIYGAYVDRLLASPHYGERWARHWMDLARYAEGRGHEFDYPVIGAWHYRDYLIRAFNADVPYDAMVKEQLAGDLMNPPRYNPDQGFNESVLGTVFLNMGEGKHSPVDTKDEEKIRIDNMIDVTSKTFLGLTVACSRCHDHKFDDIPTTDYYSLYGIFESTRSHLYVPYASSAYPAHIDSIRQLRKELKDYLNSVSEIEERPEASLIARQTTSGSKIDFEILGDFRGGDLGNWTSDGWCFGDATTLGDVVVDPETNRAGIITAGRASSQKISRGLSGALRSLTFTITHDYILFKASGKQSSFRIIMDNLQLIQDPIYGDLAKVVKGEKDSVYVSYVGMWKGHKAYIEIMPGTYRSKNGKGHYFHQDPDAWIEVSYVLGLDSLPAISQGDLLPENGKGRVSQETEIPARIWSDYQIRKNHFSGVFQDTTFFAGVIDGDVIESPVFIRGDHQQPGPDKIPHRFLTALSDPEKVFPDRGSGRLALAESIVDPSNPLTARVMVNRIWHHLFGKGLVTTVDNFGLQGSLPSHPELLDHLALKFMADGWSIKRLIKYIVLSETFRQSTASGDEARDIDPENILLHSFPVRRLEAEAIRDHLLATSGRLDPTLYGPSVPLHLTEFLQGRGRPAVSGPLDGAGRRSIYQAMWRNFLPPFMTTFDMPIPFSTFGDRSETNVPAQSLTLLNDPFVQQQSAFWAARLIKQHREVVDRITEAYLRAFSRRPTPDEIRLSQEFIATHPLNFGDNPDMVEAAIWTDFCHSLFNMKEFIYLL